MKTTSDFQFDFSLFINDKIICQRLFKCNKHNKSYIDFDKAVEIITTITILIKEHIKYESIDLLWKCYASFNQKPMFFKEPKNDLLKLTISYNSKHIASSCIDVTIYPPKVKYNIDIRPIIPVILKNIKISLSK